MSKARYPDKNRKLFQHSGLISEKRYWNIKVNWNKDGINNLASFRASQNLIFLVKCVHIEGTIENI